MRANAFGCRICPSRSSTSCSSRPGEVVTREQLIARLWPKTVVDFDANLNSSVRRLRAALQDDADAPRYIETLPRKGYRYIGAVPRCEAPDRTVARAGSVAPVVTPERGAELRGVPSRSFWSLRRSLRPSHLRRMCCEKREHSRRAAWEAS